jgi:GntR family transcriptional repressor for pyruvate dehydrogenase complex
MAAEDEAVAAIQLLLGSGQKLAGLEPAPVHPVLGGGAIERRSLSEQVANRLMSMIRSGNLKPGDRLPTEQQMCIAFAISRPPLREALKALVIMGLLESRQGGRYTVTDLSSERLLAPLNMTLSASSYDAMGHFEARAVVDLGLVRMAAERATSEELRRIQKLAFDGRAFHDQPAAFRLLDIEFHQAINDAAHSAMLASLGRGLYDIGLDDRRAASTEPGVIETSVGQHIEVAEALLDRNADLARGAYRRHLEHVRDSTVSSIARRHKAK